MNALDRQMLEMQSQIDGQRVIIEKQLRTVRLCILYVFWCDDVTWVSLELLHAANFGCIAALHLIASPTMLQCQI